MKQLATLLLVLVAFASQAQTTCVDPLACNFTESGECIYVDENGDLCVVEGCNIEGACNYDPEADLNDGSCDFESCLGCTDETACNFDPEALYLDNSCIYYIDCNGTCGGDWIQDECGNCYAPVGVWDDAEVVWTFTNCGAEGRFGPTQNQCDGEYGVGVVTSEEGVQSWVVPFSGHYEIEAVGASGSSGDGGSGGRGARVMGSFDLSEGQTLRMAVGQKGSLSSWNSGSGGGGSFVWLSANTQLLLAAGGGGGAGGNQGTSHPGANGSLEEGGSDAIGINPASGGIQGQGGSSCGSSGDHCHGGAAGAGWLGDGDGSCDYCNVPNSASGGTRIVAGGEGGLGSSSYGAHGGFGGGGGSSIAGGGGGGYSGGAAGNQSPGWNENGGGGGGSFISEIATEQLIQTSSSFGHGSIVLRFFPVVAPICELGCTTLQACNYNENATNDDGTCDYCFCGPGTEYSVEAGQCLVVEGCTDFNDDGCTGTQDLLHLLSNFGNCDE